MNKYTLVTLGALCLSGCFGVSPEQCNEYAVQLKSSNDVIQVLNSYTTYRDYANKRNHSIKETLLAPKEYDCWKESLRRQDINYACLNEQNTSDQCILYRRNNKIESEVYFFDFKRFLPSGSKIKTEADFKMALNYYETNTKACNKQSDKTSQEKQLCITKVVNDVRDFSKYGARSCETILNKEYTALLKEKGEWYEWAINHDPYGLYREWVGMTGMMHRDIQMSMYQPVYSESGASAKVKEELETWGKEHLCSTSNYVNDLSQLGFHLE